MQDLLKVDKYISYKEYQQYCIDSLLEVQKEACYLDAAIIVSSDTAFSEISTNLDHLAGRTGSNQHDPFDRPFFIPDRLPDQKEETIGKTNTDQENKLQGGTEQIVRKRHTLIQQCNQYRMQYRSNHGSCQRHKELHVTDEAPDAAV